MKINTTTASIIIATLSFLTVIVQGIFQHMDSKANAQKIQQHEVFIVGQRAVNDTYYSKNWTNVAASANQPPIVYKK